MNRNLLALDLLLLALCGLAVWRFNESRRERLVEQANFLRRSEVAVPAPVVLMPQPLAPVAAGHYLEVAQNLLLSIDRNPSVILDVVPPKVMPPLPRAYGAMSFGDEQRVFMAERPGGRQFPAAVGDMIGDFKLIAITQAGLVFEWDGKQVAARYDEMKDSGAAAKAASAPPPQASAPPPPSSAQLKKVEETPSAAIPTGDVRGRPGAVNGKVRNCLKGDDSPDGTIAEGYRKVVPFLPMGQTCHWEKVE